MKFHEYKPEWLDILRRQEEILRVERMTADDALALGMIMIRRAKEYLRTHFREPHAVKNAAEICGISERWFRELFSAAYAMTPNQYLALQRIEYAKELLHSGSYSLEETAVLCGFRDVYYFSKCFKNRTGFSPGAYKKCL